jgi:HEAT repeats
MEPTKNRDQQLSDMLDWLDLTGPGFAQDDNGMGRTRAEAMASLQKFSGYMDELSDGNGPALLRATIVANRAAPKEPEPPPALTTGAMMRAHRLVGGMGTEAREGLALARAGMESDDPAERRAAVFVAGDSIREARMRFEHNMIPHMIMSPRELERAAMSPPVKDELNLAEEAAGALRHGLADPEPAVRRQAVQGMREYARWMGHGTVLKNDPVRAERQRAADDAVFDDIAAAVHDPDPGVRKEAVGVLSEYIVSDPHAPRATAILKGLYPSETDPEVRTQIAGTYVQACLARDMRDLFRNAFAPASAAKGQAPSAP